MPPLQEIAGLIKGLLRDHSGETKKIRKPFIRPAISWGWGRLWGVGPLDSHESMVVGFHQVKNLMASNSTVAPSLPLQVGIFHRLSKNAG